MQHNNDEKVSLKELRERFYQLRDVEIQNLWQRTSIFAGFIGLLFAGYGYIFLGSSTSDPTVKHAWSCGVVALLLSELYSLSSGLLLPKVLRLGSEFTNARYARLKQRKSLVSQLNFAWGNYLIRGERKSQIIIFYQYDQEAFLSLN